MMADSIFSNKLSEILGDAHILTSGDLSAFEVDQRKRFRGKARAVVMPKDVLQISQIVRLCNEYGVSIVTQGGNTGLVIGSVPDESGQQILLSTRRMKSVLEVDANNLTITAQAGATLYALHTAAQIASCEYPLDMASAGSCTLGGNLATNAGGLQVLQYGTARDLCLGLEVVTASGEILSELSGLRKNNSGYSLKDLYIGSEGTLGIITAATMKLIQQPRTRQTMWLTLENIDNAVELLTLARKHLGCGLISFEIISQNALELVQKHNHHLCIPQIHPYQVLIEYASYQGNDESVNACQKFAMNAIEQKTATNAVMATSIAQSKELWYIRESIAPSQAKEGLNIKHDISLPTSKIPQFTYESQKILEEKFAGVRIINFGHLGDGNLHYNIQAPEGENPQDFLNKNENIINEIVFDIATKLGGTISAEHGIGSLKAQILPRYKSEIALNIMRSIKKALDPNNIMNPNRVIL